MMSDFCISETVIKRLAGNIVYGYVDGDLTSAKFNKPKSFAVDLNGNVYVADPRNHAIRKITKSGGYITMFKQTVHFLLCFQEYINASMFRG